MVSKHLVGSFSVIVKIDGAFSFSALVSTLYIGATDRCSVKTLYSPLGVLVLALALLRLLAVDGDVGVVLLLHRHDPLTLQLDVIVIPRQKIF